MAGSPGGSGNGNPSRRLSGRIPAAGHEGGAPGFQCAGAGPLGARVAEGARNSGAGHTYRGRPGPPAGGVVHRAVESGGPQSNVSRASLSGRRSQTGGNRAHGLPIRSEVRSRGLSPGRTRAFGAWVPGEWPTGSAAREGDDLWAVSPGRGAGRPRPLGGLPQRCSRREGPAGACGWDCRANAGSWGPATVRLSWGKPDRPDLKSEAQAGQGPAGPETDWLCRPGATPGRMEIEFPVSSGARLGSRAAPVHWRYHCLRARYGSAGQPTTEHRPRRQPRSAINPTAQLPDGVVIVCARGQLTRALQTRRQSTGGQRDTAIAIRGRRRALTL